jgi:hypothetical protein
MEGHEDDIAQFRRYNQKFDEFVTVGERFAEVHESLVYHDVAIAQGLAVHVVNLRKILLREVLSMRGHLEKK